MSEADNNGKTPVVKRWGWIKTKLIPILGLLFVLGIVVGVFYLYRYHPEKVEELEGFGYLGVFLISLLLNATIILPAGNFLVNLAKMRIDFLQKNISKDRIKN